MHERTIVSTENAPKAIGPYSQAVKAFGFVFTSGQIPLDPKSGEMVGGDDARAQTTQIMKNLAAVLEAAGTSFDNVVKTTIFVTNLADFTAVNETYGAYFTAAPPARSTVQVAALPKGARVEIEMVAIS
ncbi:MAG: RidA family protein [Sandaracinaceae bacterium]|nr:RidA family protein [Sandaracinaceae bacterium]